MSQQDTQQSGAIKRRSEVIRAGKACAQIIAQLGDPVQGPAARMLQDLIAARTGVTVPVVEPAAAVGERQWPGGMTHIVVGVLGTNQVVQELYYQYLTLVDHVFPGPDGFALQTVADPYGKGSDFVVVAGTGARPLARAIARLADLLAWDNEQIYLSHMNIVDVPDPALRQAGVMHPRKEPGIPKDPGTHFLWLRDEVDRLVKQESTEREAGGTLLAHACCAATYYLMSGKTGFLDSFYAAIKGHSRLSGPGEGTHKHLHQVMALWNLVGAAGLWTLDRQEMITGRLLELMRSDEGPARTGFARTAGMQGVLGERAAYDALSAYFGGRHFSLRHALPEAKGWLGMAHRAFAMQEGASKPFCDSAVQEGRVMWAMATYALASGEMDFFLNNACRQYCRAVMTARANRGDVPGHGASAQGMKIPVGLMAIGAHIYQRPGYLGAIHGLARPLGRAFATQMKPSDPGENYVGIMRSQVDRQFFNQAISPEGDVQRDDPQEPKVWLPDFQKAFDKLAFRAGPGIDDEFLLLDGIGAGESAHKDANTVLELSVYGRQFIVEEDSPSHPVSFARDHNGVTVAHAGVDHGTGPGAEMDMLGDLPGVGFAVTRMNGVSRSDWTRQVLWRKGHGFLFFDQMTARESGRYRYRNTWRGLGEAKCQDDGTLRLVQSLAGGRMGKSAASGATEFFIVPGEGGRVRVVEEPEWTAKAFTGYAHAPARITRMTRTIKGKRQPGDHDEFVTGLFWRRGTGEPAPKVRRVAQTAAFVMDKGFRALGWMQPQDKESQRLLGLQITARAGWIEDDRLSLFGARLFWCRFLSFSASNPVNIEWSRAQGLTVETEAQTELRFRMGPDRYTLAVDAGRHSLGRVVIELPDLYPVMDLVERAAEGMGHVVKRVDTPQARARPTQRGVRNARVLMRTVAPTSALACVRDGDRTLVAAGDAAGTVFVLDANGREVFRHKVVGPVTGLKWRRISLEAQEGGRGMALEVTGPGFARTWLDTGGRPVGSAELLEELLDKKARPDPESPGLTGQTVGYSLAVKAGTVAWVVTTETDLAIALDYLGREVWRASLGTAATALVGPDGQGRVYVSTESGRVIVLDAQTGKVLWRSRVPGLGAWSRGLVYVAGEESGSVFTYAGDAVYAIAKTDG